MITVGVLMISNYNNNVGFAIRSLSFMFTFYTLLCLLHERVDTFYTTEDSLLKSIKLI